MTGLAGVCLLGVRIPFGSFERFTGLAVHQNTVAKDALSENFGDDRPVPDDTIDYNQIVPRSYAFTAKGSIARLFFPSGQRHDFVMDYGSIFQWGLLWPRSRFKYFQTSSSLKYPRWSFPFVFVCHPNHGVPIYWPAFSEAGSLHVKDSFMRWRPVNRYGNPGAFNSDYGISSAFRDFRLSPNHEIRQDGGEGIDSRDSGNEPFSIRYWRWLRGGYSVLSLGLGWLCIWWVADIDFDARRWILWGGLIITGWCFLTIGFANLLSIH